MEKEKTQSKMGRIGYRPFWILKLSILLRAVHQLGAAVYVAAFLLDDIPKPPGLYIFLAFISGLALLFAEWMRHRQIYREVSGLTTFIKLILLGLAFHNILPSTGTVICAFLIASIGAHAPKMYRHRLLY